MKSCKNLVVGVMSILMIVYGKSYAEDKNELSVQAGLDFASRYVVRGIDSGDAPSLQPSITFSYKGFDFGWWGAYALSNNVTSYCELDTWLEYSYTLNNVMKFTVGIMDLYFPNSGIKMFNINDVDDPEGPGAHLLELGAGIDGLDTFPLSLFGYVNVYNDDGKNTYFQLDYRTELSGMNLDFFLGVAGGSKENPDYYGTDDFQVINAGLSVAREIALTEKFKLPVSVSYIVNPVAEISYMVFCLSL